MRRLIPLCCLMLGATPVAAQDTARAEVAGAKSPMAARVIGIVPGAGHIYAGETGRGFAYMGGTLGLMMLGTSAILAECIAEVVDMGERCDSSNTADIFAGAVLGLWGWSIYDAGRAAHRTNAKRRSMRVSMGLVPAPGSHPALRRHRTRTFVALSLTGR